MQLHQTDVSHIINMHFNVNLIFITSFIIADKIVAADIKVIRHHGISVMSIKDNATVIIMDS